jgi:hypothetical protein
MVLCSSSRNLISTIYSRTFNCPAMKVDATGCRQTSQFVSTLLMSSSSVLTRRYLTSNPRCCLLPSAHLVCSPYLPNYWAKFIWLRPEFFETLLISDCLPPTYRPCSGWRCWTHCHMNLQEEKDSKSSKSFRQHRHHEWSHQHCTVQYSVNTQHWIKERR